MTEVWHVRCELLSGALAVDLLLFKSGLSRSIGDCDFLHNMIVQREVHW